MSDVRLVYITLRSLTMLPPSRLTFHRHARLGYRTVCGHVAGPRMVRLRRDTAELIADPCRRCDPDFATSWYGVLRPPADPEEPADE